MYNINKRAEFKTVGDLKRLLTEVPDETRIYITGDSDCWFHIEEDETVICLDCEDLEDCYENECPLGGDISNDCADCAYACDYHFVDGECVRREK